MTDTPAIVDELKPLVPLLQQAGINVRLFPRHEHTPLNWMVIEKDGNAGDIEYNYLTGYHVHFGIEPSRTAGSSLLVVDPPSRSDIVYDHDLVVERAKTAVKGTYWNTFTGSVRFANDGLRHFAWAEPLVQLPASQKASQQ